MKVMKTEHPLGVCTVARVCPTCSQTGQMPPGTPCPTCTMREKDNSGYGCVSACDPAPGQLPSEDWCVNCPNA